MRWAKGFSVFTSLAVKITGVVFERSRGGVGRSGGRLRDFTPTLCFLLAGSSR
jgi:hypothetical protein